jgi:hypothetical protein
MLLFSEYCPLLFAAPFPPYIRKTTSNGLTEVVPGDAKRRGWDPRSAEWLPRTVWTRLRIQRDELTPSDMQRFWFPLGRKRSRAVGSHLSQGGWRTGSVTRSRTQRGLHCLGPRRSGQKRSAVMIVTNRVGYDEWQRPGEWQSRNEPWNKLSDLAFFRCRLVLSRFFIPGIWTLEIA